MPDATTLRGPINLETGPSGSFIQLFNATGTVGSSVVLPEPVLRVADVTVTNAEIKALRATPKLLVAAPGAGKTIQFVAATILMDYGTNVLAETADNLAIRYVDGSGVIASQAIEMTGFIDQSADMLTNVLPKIDIIGTKAQLENTALVLHNTGDGEFTGNAGNDTVLRVRIAFRILTTGF